MVRQPFSGLTMPVFTAFGWAGEEAAINYALSQLDVFIGSLHGSLPRDAQALLPAHGLDKGSQSVYLATGDNPANSAYIAYYARPMSLEIALTITDKRLLSKALKAAETEPEAWRQLVTDLGPEWALRIQQMEVDEDDGSTSHYQDIYKDSVEKLDEDTAVRITSRAAFLNSEPKWVTPLYFSRRMESEQAAAMGTSIVKVMSDDVVALVPLIRFMTGQAKQKIKSRPARAAAMKARPKEAPVVHVPNVLPENQFTYVSELMPLHLRKGFINLTPQHWPFFELSARTETRPVVVHFDGRYDRNSAVWRLVPDDQARIMLGPQVREWLEDHFNANDRILVTATKLENQEIQVTLQPTEE
jgi:hypothetical protein